MQGFYHRLLVGGALGVSLVTTAYAQNPTASGPSGDQAQSGRLDDIVVTAQRREQRLQDVPLSVSAVSTESLEQANITSAIDIGKVVSSALFQANNGTVTTFIRGIGNSQTPVGNEASNALYVDGVYYARITAVALRLNNIERVEVLKGPQGTLFGRNATSGLIQVVTRDPDPDDSMQGKFGIGYGNYDTVDASAYVSSGFGNGIAADLAVVYSNQQDGFGTNMFDGSDRLKTREYALRSKWVFQPAEGTKITLAGDYNHSVSDFGVQQIFRIKGATPSNPMGATGLPDGSGLAPLFGFYDASLDTKDLLTTKDYGGYGRISQELPFATLTNTTAYRKALQRFILDIDKTSQFDFFLDTHSFSKQFSNELQLVSNPDSPFDWTVGAFYFHHKYGYDPARIGGPVLGAGPGGLLIAPSFGRINSYAVYGQTTFNLAPKIRLTLGARYTHDDLKAGGKVDFAIDDVVVAPGVFGTVENKFDKLTWKGVLDYKPTDDIMAYVSASRGYKSGIFNILTFSPKPVKPELLDAYEVGIKSELFDRQLRLNAAAFYYKQHDPQVFVVPVAGTNELVNAGGASVKGFELEADASIGQNLSLRGGFTLIDTKYTSFTNAPFYSPNPNPPYGNLLPVSGDATGNNLGRAPKFSAVAGFEYRIPTQGGEFSLGANYNYVGKFYWEPDQKTTGGKYGLLDARIGYALADKTIKLSIWGSNLTKEKYYISEYEQPGSPGFTGAVGEPRRYGVRLEYQFQ